MPKPPPTKRRASHESAETDLIYVGDPMCSWCWGFVPSLRALQTHHPELPLTVVVGGLRPGPSAALLDDRLRSTLAHHWEQVAARSGQPFDYAGLERDDWRYDTELPAIAVVVMRELAPESTLQFFERLQEAFYAQAVDITDHAVYTNLVAPFPVDADVFQDRLDSAESRRVAWGDFSLVRSWGITGFPTLIGRSGERGALLSRGWSPPDQLDRAVHQWLRTETATHDSGDVCDLTGERC